jgi:hypothetical protein
VGTTGVGSSNVYAGIGTTATSVSIGGLPTNGVLLYITLFYEMDNVLQSIDYTVTEVGTPVLPALTSPAPGSTLTGSSATFTWNPGAGPVEYRLAIGTTGLGASDVYNGSYITGNSAAVSGIPTNGVALNVRLYYEISGVYLYIDYKITEAGTTVPPSLTSPLPGSTLTGSSATFTWNPGAGSIAYILTVGTTYPGAFDVYNGAQTTANTLTVPGIPTYGVTLYVRLNYEMNFTWSHIDYTFKESGTSVPPSMISPTPRTTLSGSSVTFTWNPGGGSTAFIIYAGTTGVGSENIYVGSSITADTLTISLPTNGVTLFVRLSYQVNGVYSSVDYQYTENGYPVLPSASSPAPGAVLAGSSATFTWNPGAGPSQYMLGIGTTGPGATNVYNGSPISGNSVAVSGIPTNGVTLFVRISYELNAAWSHFDYQVTEAGTPSLPSMTSPAPGSTLSGSSATFAWNPGGGPVEYILDVGTSYPGAFDVYNGSSTSASSVTVTGIPTYGVTLYVRLNYEMNSTWSHIDYTYKESGTPVPPSMISPTSRSTLSGSSVTFTWKPGGGSTGFVLYVGTLGVGSQNIYAGSYSTANTLTVSGIPTNGSIIYVEISYLMSGVYSSVNYQYLDAADSATVPSLTSPVPGGTLSGTSTTFTWNPGTGPVKYILDVGTSYPGAFDVYNGSSTTASSVTVAGIPTYGVTLYVRLNYELNNAWWHIDYTYKESGTPVPPSMISPTPGNTLSGSTATFTWNPGGGSTGYVLYVGTKGVGSQNIYAGSYSSTNTLTVSGIPTNGSTIYVEISYQMSGVYSSVNYQYTEAAGN